MKNCSSIFVFLSMVLVAIVTIVVGGTDITWAQHIIPPALPADAQCQVPKDSEFYKCKKEGVPPQGSVKITGESKCRSQCLEGGGIILDYPPSGIFSPNLTSFCFGVVKENARACEIKGTWTNLATGENITQEQAKAINPESCFVGDVPCEIGKLIKKVGNLAVQTLNSFIKGLADLLERVTSLFRKEMMSVINSFMGIPVSPSNERSPNFVQQAWGNVRNLANNFFILILAFIGLATILRLQAYQLQKTLPILLLVALLVNFSGVLVGLIADVGNIITSNFLHLAGDAKSWETTSTTNPGWGSTPETLGISIVRIIYYFISSFIFLGVMIAFGLRTIILWTLAIVSPLAFAAYILPATRGLANGWWKQLIQWSLFGIPLSFFLYLASLTLKPNSVPSVPAVEALSNFVAPFTTLFLLFTGITMSMAMAPAGAQSIIGGVNQFGKKWGGRAGLAAGTAALRFRGVGPLKMKQGIGPSIQSAGVWLKKRGDRSSIQLQSEVSAKRSELNALMDEGRSQGFTPETTVRAQKLRGDIIKLQKQQQEPETVREKAGYYTGGFVARWAGRALEAGAGELTMRMKAKDEREIAEGISEGTGKDSRDNATKINQELLKGQLANSNRIVGLLNAIVKNGDSDDLQQYIREGLLSSERIGKAILDAQRAGPPAYRPIMKAMYGRMLTDPEAFGKEFTREKDEHGNVKFKNEWVEHAVGEVPEKLTAADITAKILGDTIDKGKAGGTEFMQFGGRAVIEHIISQRGGDLASQLMRRPESILGRETMAATINQLVQDRHGELDETTLRSIFRSLTSPGARTLGVSLELINTQGRKVSLEDIGGVDEFLREFPPKQPGAAPATPSPSTTSGRPGDAYRGQQRRRGSPPQQRPSRPGDVYR